MRYFLFAWLAFITITRNAAAQDVQLINSGEVIRHAIALYDSAKYRSALTELETVSRSDTNYVWSLYEKAINFEADSQFTRGIACCREALSLKAQRDKEPNVYNTYGNILNKTGQYQQALAVFDTAINKYPALGLLYFNKGVVMLTMKKYGDAERLFKQTLLVDPYMYSAHFELGSVELMQGQIIPAVLSLTGYLLVDPQGTHWKQAVNMLGAIAGSTDEILKYKNSRKEQPDQNYAEVEDIVLSKIALDKAYKPIVTLDDPISRQLQAVMEKLDYVSADHDFWMQYYMPYLKKVYSSGRFELLINQMFSNVNIPLIQNYLKKNKKELAAFQADAAAYFDGIRATRQLIVADRDTVTNRYAFENGELVGKGVLSSDGKVLSGPWAFYYPAGNIKARGLYNNAGQREGNWLFYFAGGAIDSREHFVNGKLEGPQLEYYSNGNPSTVSDYKNGLEDGVATSYYYGGNIKAVRHYSAGKKQGEEKEFYAAGGLSAINNYEADQLSGVSDEYYKNGKLKNAGQYTNGKQEGAYKAYNQDGSLSMDGQYVNGKGEGEFKYYNGKGLLSEKRHYLGDTEEGVHTEYDDNGRLTATYTVKKGKIDGEGLYYTPSGKVYARYIYDRGTIRSAVYMDTTGHQLSTTKISGGLANIIAYTASGVKKAHFTYDKGGDLAGVDTIFYPSGKVEDISFYTGSKLNGSAVSYYRNGRPRTVTTKMNDDDNGLVKTFYSNGQIESEGWSVAGQSQGEWRYYDEFGKLTNTAYYLDNDLDGYKTTYNPAGEKVMEEKYFSGWLENLVQYDHGAVIGRDTFPKESGDYVLHFPNGKVMSRVAYVNGYFTGPYHSYYFDGKPQDDLYYTRGLPDSVGVSYYYNGKKSGEGRYFHGGKTGKWKFYDEDGKLSSTGDYVDDELNGTDVFYNADGSKDQETGYKDGLYDGPNNKYDPDGALAFQTIFKDDNAVSFACMGSDGKLGTAILLDSKTGLLKAYYANGKPSRLCAYSDGVRNGPDIEYYDNGQVSSVDTTAYGNAEGLNKTYYKNGNLRLLYNYRADNATGKCSEYRESGILHKEMTYMNGYLDGPTKLYDDKGKLIRTMMYRYGTLVGVNDEK